MTSARLIRAFEQELLAALGKAGYPDLRMPHAALFETLSLTGDRLTTLAARTQMTVQSMGEVVDDLEAKGYLTRRDDPTDRRARLIVFTDRGLAAREVTMGITAEMESDFSDIVGSERLKQAVRAFKDLLEVLDARLKRG
jgi:DNA-binding MarR family transcriptional regulator